MTSYNSSQYIGAAIESVLCSTYTNFELIIVDDVSADDTVFISKEYAKKDNRITVYENEKNLGDYPNRNKAATLARGKYLKYVDADDLIYPWGLSVLVETMERFPEAGWGLCSLDQDLNKPYPFLLNPNEIFHYHNFKSSLFHKAPLSAIIRSDVFFKVGGFSGKRQIGDTEMWHILSLNHPLVLMPHGIVWYRVHDQQESNQVRNDFKVRLRYSVSTLHFYQSVKNIPLKEHDKQKIIKRFKKKFRILFLKKIFQLQFRAALVILKSVKDHEYDFKISN
jgi:glycosyltransferase involved in cell wall biosynthesis